jgi:hypothetical protein
MAVTSRQFGGTEVGWERDGGSRRVDVDKFKGLGDENSKDDNNDNDADDDNAETRHVPRGTNLSEKKWPNKKGIFMAISIQFGTWW